MEDDILLIHIDNRDPVELGNLVDALSGLSSLYRIEVENSSLNDDYPFKLLIDKVENGSIKLFLKDNRKSILPELSPVNVFSNKLFSYLDYLKSKDCECPDFSKSQLDALYKFINLTAVDREAKLEISVNGKNCLYKSDEAYIMRNEINRLKHIILESFPETHTMISFRWADANFISNKKHGKIIVDKVSNSAKRVLFFKDEDFLNCTKNQEEFPETPWQKFIYFADIEVIYMNGKIQAYKIIKLYGEVISLE